MTVQRTFAAGEVSPSLFGRVDVDRWRSALETCRNFIVLPEGGITARPGFQIGPSGEALTGITPEDYKMVPFEFGPEDAHVLLFDGSYMYVAQNGVIMTGGHVIYDCTLDKGVTPWAITTPYAHGYSTGDAVNVIGDTVYVVTVTGATGFTLDGTVATSGTSTVNVVADSYVGTYPIMAIPFTVNQSTMRWVQSGDTMFIVDGVNRPQRLTRDYIAGINRYQSWTVEDAAVTPTIPTGVTISSSGGSGTTGSRYNITYTGREGIESAVLRTSAVTGTVSLVSSLWKVNYTAHGLLTNDTIEITEDKNDTAGTLVYKSGDYVRITKVDANNFTVAGNTLAVSGNFKYRRLGDSIGTVPSSASPITVTWTLVANAEFYNVYREYGRYFSYIGSTSGLSFIDNGIIPDAKDNPVFGKDFMQSEDGGAFDNVPSAVGLFQQRLFFGGFAEDTERIVASAVGNYIAYDPAAEDASALDFELAGKTVSNIKHMVEIAGRAVVLTSTAEWVLRGGTGGSLTPTAINARVDSYHGSSDVVPAVVGANLLFVQRGGKILRDAQYDFSQEALASRDLTLWSKHLFDSEIKTICYQRSEQIVWCLLEDGTLLGMTYIPDQQVWGWHRHDIAQGVVIQDICVISEENRDRLYAFLKLSDTEGVVSRLPLINVDLDSVDDFYGYDLGITVNNSALVGEWTLTGGTNWTTDETLTLTADVTNTYFSSGAWIGTVFRAKLGDDHVYLRMTAWTSATVISVVPLTVVPEAMRGVAISEHWYAGNASGTSIAATMYRALDGYTVTCRMDGGLETDYTLVDDDFTSTINASHVQLGIPVECRAKTLDLESTDVDSLMGDFRHVTKVRLRVVKTRAAKAGLTEATLEEMIPIYASDYQSAPSLQDGVKEILMDSAHDESGSVIIAQEDGMPTTVTNVRVLFNAGKDS